MKNHCHILIVDDNTVNRLVLSSYLRLQGHVTEEVENGLEAVEAVGKDHFDLVLMDLWMPVMDGVSATRRIRQMESERGADRVPIVAVTAAGRQMRCVECMSSGMDDFIEKPVDFKRLDQIMRNVLTHPDGKG